MKLIGVYGANIETNGFSGYLCELLVLKYGSFKNVLKAVADWKYGTRLDLKKTTTKFKEALTFIDPTDSRRNVAAAVSEENYCTFITLARAYSEKGHLPMKRKLLPGRGKVYVIEWDIGEENEEIIWSQLQRFEKKVRKALISREFGVIDSWVWTDCTKKAQLLLELEVWELPAVNDWPGPSVYDRTHAQKFIEKYGKIVIRGNRVVTERKREYRTAKAFIKHLLKQPPSHLVDANYVIKQDSSAKKTKAFKEYSRKFWVLR
jgi:tRNA nucleotidyltransferase (CCA-adding enzyme)